MKSQAILLSIFRLSLRKTKPNLICGIESRSNLLCSRYRSFPDIFTSSCISRSRSNGDCSVLHTNRSTKVKSKLKGLEIQDRDRFRPILLQPIPYRTHFTRSRSRNHPPNMSAKLDLDLGNKQIRLPNFSTDYHQSDLQIADGVEDKDLHEGFHDVVSSCALCLSSGGVIAVPTDTIYGVAGLAQNTKAVNMLYEIKQRNYTNPVAISVGRIDDIYRWSQVTVSRQVLEDLLPGPVTVVFERSPSLNTALNPHTQLVGIRIPGHKFMQDLAKKCDSPIALTSANISGATSCLKVEEFDSLWPRLDLVVNGGVLSDSEEARLGSTVVDLSVAGKFRIIRPGSAHKPTLVCLREKHGLQEITSET